MTKVRSYVGLDLHAHSTQASVLDTATGELVRRRLAGPPEVAIAFLEQLAGPVSAVYEAGPIALASPAWAPGGRSTCASARRRSSRAGRPTGSRPTRAMPTGWRAFWRRGSLWRCGCRASPRSSCAIWCAPGRTCAPTLTRARHPALQAAVAPRAALPGTRGAWTQDHLAWIAGLSADDASTRAVLADYRSALEGLLQRRTVLEAALEAAALQAPFAEPVARLRAFRGLDTLSALGLVAEIGEFAPFAHARQVGDYLGLVPSERSSGASRRQGAITKAGPRHARRLLVEAAWHYRREPRIGDALRRRQRGIDPQVVQVAWRAQRRLHRRWQHLAHERGKPSNLVAVACARELTTFLWEAALID